MKIAILVLLFSPVLAEGAPGSLCFNFAAFPVSKIFAGPYISPKFVTGSKAYHFRTTIRADAVGSPNFAGHLRIILWGCGTDCQRFAIVDEATGKVLVPEQAVAAAVLGLKHFANSKLLVINPPEARPDAGILSTVPSVSYVWDEITGKLRLLPGCDGYKAKSPNNALQPTALTAGAVKVPSAAFGPPAAAELGR